MIKLLIVTIYVFSFTLSSTFAQWVLRYPQQPTLGINDMVFINQSVGLAVNGSGSILETTDGGLHWSISKHYQRDNISEIKFVDDQNGFCISPHSYIGDSQDFMFTTDGGSYWQSTYLGTSDALTFLPLSISEMIKSGDQGQYQNWIIFLDFGVNDIVSPHILNGIFMCRIAISGSSKN